jgi:hypothetical protein
MHLGRAAALGLNSIVSIFMYRSQEGEGSLLILKVWLGRPLHFATMSCRAELLLWLLLLIAVRQRGAALAFGL